MCHECPYPHPHEDGRWGVPAPYLNLEDNPFECLVHVHWNSESRASDSRMEDRKGGARKRGQLAELTGGREG